MGKIDWTGAGGASSVGPQGPTGPTGPAGSANASGAAGQLGIFSGSTSLSGNADLSFDSTTSTLWLRHDNVGTTNPAPVGLGVTNQTPATVSLNQNTPWLVIGRSAGWRTDSGGSSVLVELGMQLRPQSASGAPTMRLYLGYRAPAATGTWSDLGFIDLSDSSFGNTFIYPTFKTTSNGNGYRLPAGGGMKELGSGAVSWQSSVTLDPNFLGQFGINVATGRLVTFFAGAATPIPVMADIGGAAIQSGAATLTAGTTSLIAATVTANTRILVSQKTPNTTSSTVQYSALSADRVVGVSGAGGGFKLTALLAAGSINVLDGSTLDWVAFG